MGVHQEDISNDGSRASSPRPSPSSDYDSSAQPHLSHLPTEARKIVANLQNYLALGCICTEHCLTDGILQDAGSWQEITLDHVSSLSINPEMARHVSALLRHGWIRVRARRIAPRHIYRIHLLYHDVGLSSIDRHSRRLIAAVGALASEVDVNPDTWHAHDAPAHRQSFDMYATQDEDNPSLFWLFNQLPSPSPSPSCVSGKYEREALQDLLNPPSAAYAVPGLKTTLYPYQRRSAGAMLQRESVPRQELDPRLEHRYAADGSSFFYFPRELRFFKDPVLLEANTGGLLAESMGLGKTLICLSLILATKNILPEMPSKAPPVRSTVGSLVEMTVSAINRKSIPWRIESERIRAADTNASMSGWEKALNDNPPYYHLPTEVYRRSRNIQSPKRMLVARTTIIVVPQNLCKQWTAEINKHVEADALKVLVLDSREVLTPSPDILTTYDILLFTRNRFDIEVQDGRDSEGRRMPARPRKCTCTYKGSSRTRDCHCLKIDDLYDSSLKYVHFKRLIVDEGHFFSTNTSSTIIVANKLVKADYRWVISGTPAKDMLGVEVDLQDPSLSNQELLEQRRHFDTRLDRAGAIESLNSLATNFLRCTPWSSASQAKDYIYRHEGGKTFSGFSSCMRRLLEGIVVKTRWEDLELELPPLTHTPVFLAPSFYDKLTANLFTLVLTANAVTSERSDNDYLFHKNNTKALLQLVRNLRQSAFFWSGFSEADVLASIENSKGYLENNRTNCTEEDREMLWEILQSTEELAQSQGWKSMTRSHEMGIFVQDWPEHSAQHWAFDDCGRPLLTGISQLLEAQKFVNERLTLEDPGEGLSGAGIRSTKVLKPSAAEPSEESQFSGIPASSVEAEPILRRKPPSSSTGRKSSPRKPPSANPKPKTSDVESTIQNFEVALPEDSPYAKAKIVGTASSKLSYLVSRILEYHQDEKILVFYSGENAAYYLGQCLELFHVEHRIYAKTLPAELKAEYVVNFQEQERIRVLLMDVNQAAFGLNICAASRIYFVNPVCRPSIEAQAIKRAHRIGQTRKVTCETLILQGSLEHKMYERSQRMTRAEHLDAKVLEDDGGIREIIQSARMLPLADTETGPGPGQMAPFMQGRSERLWCRPGWKEFADNYTDRDRPGRKRKRTAKANPNPDSDFEEPKCAVRIMEEDSGRRNPQDTPHGM